MVETINSLNAKNEEISSSNKELNKNTEVPLILENKKLKLGIGNGPKVEEDKNIEIDIDIFTGLKFWNINHSIYEKI